jgi:hypothetical protein
MKCFRCQFAWIALSAVSILANLGAGSDAAEPAATEQPNYPPGYIVEGPLPEGFPPPSEPGAIVEKNYPLCRTYSATGNNAFGQCFVYLATRKHEMTAPVIIDYRRRDEGAPARPSDDIRAMNVDRMHFILEKPTLDKPQKVGPIVVADMPTLRVLSLAIQGEMTEQVLDEVEQKLTAEIARRGDIVAAGPKRVLGYNSPMVPRGKAFWEVQLPIAERQPASGD